MRSVIIACIVLVVAAFLLERSCHFEHRFSSPDGDAAVVLMGEANLGDSNHAFVLEEGWFRSTDLAPAKQDCILLFAHAAWSADSRRVVFYRRDALCPTVWVAYDRERRTFQPVESMADIMRQSLRDTYQLTDVTLNDWNGDPLEWMQSSSQSAPEAFRVRFRK